MFHRICLLLYFQLFSSNILKLLVMGSLILLMVKCILSVHVRIHVFEAISINQLLKSLPLQKNCTQESGEKAA